MWIKGWTFRTAAQSTPIIAQSFFSFLPDFQPIENTFFWTTDFILTALPKNDLIFFTQGNFVKKKCFECELIHEANNMQPLTIFRFPSLTSALKEIQ